MERITSHLFFDLCRHCSKAITPACHCDLSSASFAASPELAADSISGGDCKCSLVSTQQRGLFKDHLRDANAITHQSLGLL